MSFMYNAYNAYNACITINEVKQQIIEKEEIKHETNNKIYSYYMIQFFKDIFFHPKVTFIIFSIFITIYMSFLFYEHAFDGDHFLKLGPSDDLAFIGMKINTWKKVYAMYAIGFFSTLLIAYHQTVMYDFIHSKIWNQAYEEKIELSKTFTIMLMSFEPFFYFLLRIMQFYVTMTMQLQFLIPELIAQCLVDIPYGIMKANEKKYAK